MKKLLITIVCIVCAGSLFALQAITVVVTNDLPTTAAQAGVYGYTKFQANGENMKVYSQIGTITLNSGTLTGTLASASVTNEGAYSWVQYPSFATATEKTYEGAFEKGGLYELWLTAEEALSSATGTDIVQNVYIVVY